MPLFLLLSIHTAAGGKGYGFALVQYVGFFTILTNGLCAVVFTAHAWHGGQGALWRGLRSAWFATSAACSIVVVGAVYFLVLRHLWQPQGAQWAADAMLHYLVPVLFAGFWWRAVPAGSLHWGQLPHMLAYPAVYLVYVFVRGAILGLYPYPFIDVTALGYGMALRNATGLFLLFAGLSATAIFVKRQRIGRGAAAVR